MSCYFFLHYTVFKVRPPLVSLATVMIILAKFFDKNKP